MSELQTCTAVLLCFQLRVVLADLVRCRQRSRSCACSRVAGGYSLAYGRLLSPVNQVSTLLNSWMVAFFVCDEHITRRRFPCVDDRIGRARLCQDDE